MPSERNSRDSRKGLAKLNEETQTRLSRLEEALINEAAGFEGQRSSSSMQTAVHMETHSGPLPHPEILASYERVLPGLADRIISMAEKQQTHRHGLESLAITSGVARSKQGLAAGFLVTILFLLAAVWLILAGHDVAGSVVGTVDLVALVSLFVIGQRSQANEREKKRRERDESLGS